MNNVITYKQLKTNNARLHNILALEIRKDESMPRLRRKA